MSSRRRGRRDGADHHARTGPSARSASASRATVACAPACWSSTPRAPDSLELLDAARQAGARRAVIHPLQSVPSRERGVENLPGSYFRIEADQGALRWVRALVRALGGRELALPRWRSDPAVSRDLPRRRRGGFELPGDAARFRGAAPAGARRRPATGAPGAVAAGAGHAGKLERLGVPGALTGPIARGDAQTVAGHVAALQQRAPDLLELYVQLALRTIPLAQGRGGLSARAAEKISANRATIAA